MEDRNELSDIILEKDSIKSIKAKRILIIVALLIVIFLVVLVAMRVINKPDTSSDRTNLILPPQPIEKTVEPQKDENLFKQIPIVEVEEKKESFEEMVKSLKDKEIQKQENRTEDIEKIVEKIEVKELPKIDIPLVVQKPTPLPKKVAPIKSKSDNIATTGIYIQVGATTRLTPDKKFLAKLASKGYEHKLLPKNVKGKKVTKILIGPFANSTVAGVELEKVKSSIKKDAFIFRVK